MRHTKIIATVGPASDSDAMLDALIAAGDRHLPPQLLARHARVAAPRPSRASARRRRARGAKWRSSRISRGPEDPHRSAARRSRRSASKPGDTLRIATGDFVGGRGRVSTTFAGLARRTCGRATACCWPTASSNCASTRPTAPRFRRPSSRAASSASTKASTRPACRCRHRRSPPKDVDDLKFGLVARRRHGGDQLRAERRRPAAGAADPGGRRPCADVPLVAKLERPQALEHLDDILAVGDAVMVARGDLGLEMPLERVPRAQKEITAHARRRRASRSSSRRRCSSR